MPTYAPQDMAYILRMTKPSGKMTKEEMDLVQNIGQAVAPLGARPVDMPMQQPMPQAMAGSLSNADMAAMQKQAMPQGQPVNRLAALQAAANAQLAGQGDAPNPNMGNIAKYFQGRQ
jgi:hypothetical protein